MGLAEWLDGNGMDHVRGAPNHPQTQGKIERWHQTLKNRILLENYYLPGDLERAMHRFVEYYNHARYHESLQNLTPGRRLLRARAKGSEHKGEDQTRDNSTPTIDPLQNRSLNLNPN